jgi:GNAT superfamily N-acetyltransferase
MELILKTNLPESENIWKLFLTTGWNEEYNLTEAEYYNAVIKSRFVVSMYCKDKLIGCGRVVCDGVVHAIIYDLIVLPEFQKFGAGTKILFKLIELCKDDGIRDVQLFSARGKREFYEKRGFVMRAEDAPGMDYRLHK